MCVQKPEKHKEKELVNILSNQISEFSKNNSLSDSETILLLEKIKNNIISKQKIQKTSPEIPLSVFQRNLGCLESISLYLKDNLDLKFSEISRLTNRDQRTIWTAYNKAKQKVKTHKLKKTIPSKSKYFLPVSIISDRNLSTLEAIVLYLKSYHNLSFADIASILNRAPQNIWAVYNKAKKKEGVK